MDLVSSLVPPRGTNQTVIPMQESSHLPTQQAIAPRLPVSEVYSVLSDGDSPGEHQIPLPQLPHLRLQLDNAPAALPWLQMFPPTGALQKSWWYECILEDKITFKKSKDDPSHEGKHDLQWSGLLFKKQCNVQSVDIVAWLGRVHLGPNADLCMEATPSVQLPEEWRFLPGKVGLPFLSAVAHATSNDGCALFFACLMMTWRRRGDPVMAGIVSLQPYFRPCFFTDSPVLLSGFQKLIFSNGLDYATTTSAAPPPVSCWHFVSSVANLPDGYILPNGLTAPQLAQVLINYHACFEQVFANGHDYTKIPTNHTSPITWQGAYHGGLIIAICYLMLPDTIMVWNEHRQGPTDQGHRLTIGFLHHMGVLMRIFEDWLDIAEQEQQYCQPFIAFDPAIKARDIGKTGYVLAMSMFAEVDFAAVFEEWRRHFATMFGTPAIHSGHYLQEDVFTYEPPPFILLPTQCNSLDPKWTGGTHLPTSRDPKWF